jgi:hypothetical protein
MPLVHYPKVPFSKNCKDRSFHSLTLGVLKWIWAMNSLSRLPGKRVTPMRKTRKTRILGPQKDAIPKTGWRRVVRHRLKGLVGGKRSRAVLAGVTGRKGGISVSSGQA